MWQQQHLALLVLVLRLDQIGAGVVAAVASAVAASGFLPEDQSVVELHFQDFDSPVPLPQRLRVSLIFEHVDSVFRSSSSCCCSPTNSTSSSNSSSCNSDGTSTTYCSTTCTATKSDPPPIQVGLADAVAADLSPTAAAAIGAAAAPTETGPPEREAIPGSSNTPSSSNRPPPSKSLVGGIVCSLLRWQHPRDHPAEQQTRQQQLHQQLPHHEPQPLASHRLSTCSSVSLTETFAPPLPGSAEAGAAVAGGGSGLSVGAGTGSLAAALQRHLHITRRPTPSRRDFAARHCLQIDPVSCCCI